MMNYPNWCNTPAKQETFRYYFCPQYNVKVKEKRIEQEFERELYRNTIRLKIRKNEGRG